MAWALKFDGVNDNAKVGVSGLPIIGYYDITFKFNQLSSNNAAKICDSYDGFNRFDINITGGFFDLRDYAKVQVDGVDNGEVFTGVPVDIRIYRDVTCSDQGDKNLGTLMSRYTSSFFAGGELISVDVKNGIGGGDLFLDATASSHAAGTPILTDTVGDNDATGVNMPTDGSAWVDLGGGSLLMAIDNTTQAQTVDQVTLTQHSVLSINDATQAQTAEQVTLQQAGTLSLNNLEQIQTVEQINLTQAHIISVDGATQSQTVDQVSLLVAGTLAVNNTSQSQALEQAVLSVIASLSIDSLSNAQTVEQVILSTISASAVAVNSIGQQQTVDQLNLTQAHVVSVDNLSQEQLLESINFNGVVVGYLQGALTIISAYNGQIKLTNPLTGEIRIL